MKTLMEGYAAETRKASFEIYSLIAFHFLLVKMAGNLQVAEY